MALSLSFLWVTWLIPVFQLPTYSTWRLGIPIHGPSWLSLRFLIPVRRQQGLMTEMIGILAWCLLGAECPSFIKSAPNQPGSVRSSYFSSSAAKRAESNVLPKCITYARRLSPFRKTNVQITWTTSSWYRLKADSRWMGFFIILNPCLINGYLVWYKSVLTQICSIDLTAGTLASFSTLLIIIIFQTDPAMHVHFCPRALVADKLVWLMTASDTTSVMLPVERNALHLNDHSITWTTYIDINN